MRILIYGAGVIGSLYGALLSGQNEVTVYARGARLKDLEENGLRYRAGDGSIRSAAVRVLPQLAADDRYDYVFVTVRQDQLTTALKELKSNQSPTLVTMVNALDDYENWETLCGKGRILPAFPGAGGGFRNGVLEAGLTPQVIQPTTFGEISGRKTARVRKLAQILKAARIPRQIVPDMHAWQICHLAMVVPLADAYYEAEDPARAGWDRALMKRTAVRIQENLAAVREKGTALSPKKMKLFQILPTALLATGLSYTYRSSFGDRFMYRHSMKAPGEMRVLHEQFYTYLQQD